MEPVYEIKSTYDEEMYFHQVVASKPRMMPKEDDGKKIRFRLPDFGLKDTLMALLVGAAVYMAFQAHPACGMPPMHPESGYPFHCVRYP